LSIKILFIFKNAVQSGGAGLLRSFGNPAVRRTDGSLGVLRAVMATWRLLVTQNST
jgi:hypothetical protein